LAGAAGRFFRNCPPGPQMLTEIGAYQFRIGSMELTSSKQN
jgi:hypothetical protein